MTQLPIAADSILTSVARRISRAVVLLCAAGVTKVLLLSLAFPFFSNVDEEAHFDLIYKYSRADVPKGLTAYNRGSARFLLMFASWEFLNDPAKNSSLLDRTPNWESIDQFDPAAVQAAVAQRAKDGNHESMQPPVYYALAGGWLKAVSALPLRDGYRLYAPRLLNALCFGALIWLTYRLARELAPSDHLLQLGAAAVVLAMPQDIYYVLNNDVLLAPTAALTVLLLVRWYRAPSPAGWFSALVGLSAAAGVLVKFSNAPLGVVLIIVAVMKLLHNRSSDRWLPTAIMLFAAAAPVVLWCLRNYMLLGDITGNSYKVRYLGWTPKPFSEYFNHPIFTPGGFAQFWAELVNTFWNGELYWHGRRLGWKWISWTCIAAATILPVVYIVRARRREPMIVYGGLTLAALWVGLMVWLSVSFDFGECVYPSREWPYFTSGRLLLGFQAPASIMCFGGARELLGRRRKALGIAVAVFCALLLVGEFLVCLPVFASRYNFFHL